MRDVLLLCDSIAANCPLSQPQCKNALHLHTHFNDCNTCAVCRLSFLKQLGLASDSRELAPLGHFSTPALRWLIKRSCAEPRPFKEKRATPLFPIPSAQGIFNSVSLVTFEWKICMVWGDWLSLSEGSVI